MFKSTVSAIRKKVMQTLQFPPKPPNSFVMIYLVNHAANLVLILFHGYFHVVLELLYVTIENETPKYCTKCEIQNLQGILKYNTVNSFSEFRIWGPGRSCWGQMV